MSLKVRILLSVTLLFFLCLFSIFILTGYEMHKSIKREEKEIAKKISYVNTEYNALLKKYFGEKFTNMSEEIDFVFEQIETTPIWKVAFLPDKYNLLTKNWATAATLLKRYAWITFINVQINKMNSAYIYFSSPFLRKYVEIPIKKDLTIFITKENDKLTAYIGIPFWSQEIKKQILNPSTPPDFIFFNSPNKWLLYTIDQILSIDPNKLTIKQGPGHKRIKTKIGTTFPLDQIEEFNVIIENIKKQIALTKTSLSNDSSLIAQLKNTNTLKSLLKKASSTNSKSKSSKRICKSQLCKQYHLSKERKWTTSEDLSHRATLRAMTWDFFMLTRTGVWDYTPFSNLAPVAFASNTSINDYDHEKNILVGSFIKDLTIKKPLNRKSDCTFKPYSPQFDKQIIFHNKQEGKISSCHNKHLQIVYTKKVKQPYLTATIFIKMTDPSTGKVNETKLTLGIAIDPVLKDAALMSSGNILFLFKGKDIRFYSIDGTITNIANTDDIDRETILKNTSGTIKMPNGSLFDFVRIGKITEDDGYIILLYEGKSELTASLSKTIDATLKKITLESITIGILCLIIISLILLKVISKITKPINELVEITKDVGKGNLQNIHLNKDNLGKTDEIGTLYNSFSDMIDTMKEGQKIKGVLDKVISKEIASKILKDGINLGGEIKNLTIMFCDIRKFTSISENMDPKDVLLMLNESLTILASVIEKHEGVIDSFEGDRIMTLFGAPIETKDHIQKAVLCAIEMQEAMHIWNHEREISGFCKLEIGIGIHTGEAVAGNVGTENHLSYSVIGHIVNLTSRLCDSAKANEIIITQEIIDNSRGINFEQRPPQKFRGLSKEIITYKIKDKKQ